MLVGMRWINPPTTAVRAERQVQGWFQPDVHGKPYREHYEYMPLKMISPNLQHAVVSAEDARFYLIMDSTGTRCRLMRPRIWKAGGCVELRQLRSSW